MNAVAHVVARGAVDDPHTLSVLAIADAMRNGEPAAVFTASAGDRIDGVKPLARLAANDDRFLVYHECGAAPALVSRLAKRNNDVAVVHGDPVPDALARLDLQLLASAGAIGLATSDAAAARLDDLGFAAVHRVAPVVARQRLAAVEPFPPTAHHLDVAVHGPLIFSVADMTGATNAAHVVQAYHVLRTYLLHVGHLAIAVPDAPDTDETTVQWVPHREIWGLRLTEAWLHRLGHPGERAALTRRSVVFVTTDPAVGDVRHALAAMAEGVPVVAAADASATEALGAGALCLPPDAGAALIAEALADLLTDEARRARCAAATASVVDRYDPVLVAPAWRAALAA